MYTVRFDAQHGIIDAVLGGFMSAEEIGSYMDAIRHEVIANGLSSYALMADVCDCKIQSQDTVGALERHIATIPKARALALVVGSSLARMQVRRIFTQPYARVVSNRSEGLAWVVSGVEPAVNLMRCSTG